MAQSRRPSIVVLLIDDQLIIAERIRELLATESYIAVHHCQNSVAAFDAATTVKPTVILQDLMMPGVDGLEVLQQLTSPRYFVAIYNWSKVLPGSLQGKERKR
jgi:two-component system chemotaxis family response regulator WspR